MDRIYGMTSQFENPAAFSDSPVAILISIIILLLIRSSFGDRPVEASVKEYCKAGMA